MSPNASVAKYCAFGEGVEKRILGFMQSRQFTQQKSYQTNSSSVTHARRHHHPLKHQPHKRMACPSMTEILPHTAC